MVRNWQYYENPDPFNDLYISQGQYMAGNIMGVLIAPKPMQCQKGHIGNAGSFDYPVRYQVITHLYDSKELAEKEIKDKIKILEAEGCRFIITSGEEFGLFHEVITNATDLLALSTPLLAVPLAASSIKKDSVICIMNRLSVETNLRILHGIGIESSIIDKCIFSDVRMDSNSEDKKKNTDAVNETIGAYIWDCAEPCAVRGTKGSQIYHMINLAGLLKKSAVQIHYRGYI